VDARVLATSEIARHCIVHVLLEDCPNSQLTRVSYAATVGGIGSSSTLPLRWALRQSITSAGVRVAPHSAALLVSDRTPHVGTCSAPFHRGQIMCQSAALRGAAMTTRLRSNVHTLKIQFPKLALRRIDNSFEAPPEHGHIRGFGQ
jgi:hypothetical protein